MKQYRNNKTSLYISQQIIREYMVPFTMPASGIPVEQVIKNIEIFRKNFTNLKDDELVMNKLIELIKSYNFGGKQIHDANIVATMKVYGINNLLTNNVTDFIRFKDIINIIQL
ncbi:MAG: VapC toxin family PIN domain ribonuclease [Candidatus Eremiobacterota bacterium]